MRRGRLLYVPPALRVQLHDQTVSVAGLRTGPVTASYRLSGSGKVLDQSGHILESWALSGSGPTTGYEARATLLSGAVTGAFGSWSNIGLNDPTWSVTATSGTPSVSGQIKVEIRDAATLVVLVSAVIDIAADFGS